MRKNKKLMKVGNRMIGRSKFHTPVMLEEVLEYLQVKRDRKYVDATLGGGGHSAAIIARGGCLLGLDLDLFSMRYCQNLFIDDLKFSSRNFRLAQGNFRDIEAIAKKNDFKKVAGVLFDLGISSWQIEKSGRGFSFTKDEPLDMRMDLSLQVKAKDLINGLAEKELYVLFKKFGEEGFSRRIARAIVRARRVKPIKTSRQLAEIVVGAYPRGLGVRRIHPATKVFQALRIVVNDELESLRVVLLKAINLLEQGGRLVVISFHSLEDRIVKTEFLKYGSVHTAAGDFLRVKILTKKPIRPLAEEIARNPRARSAKLRAIEKL